MDFDSTNLDFEIVITDNIDNLNLLELEFANLFHRFNPILMVAYMYQRYVNATPAEKNFEACEDCDSFERVLSYIVAIFCKSGNNIDMIVAKSPQTVKGDMITLKKLFNIQNKAKADFSVTLARVANIFGQMAIKFYKVHNFPGPLSLSSIGDNLPCAIRAPGFSCTIPGLSFKIDGQLYSIEKLDRNIIIKACHILACLLDKQLNSSKSGYRVHSQKVLRYVHYSYEQGIMDSNTRIKCLIHNEIFLDSKDSINRVLCLPRELSFTLKMFNIENFSFISNVDYRKFDNPPKSDTITFAQQKIAAVKILKDRFIDRNIL